MGAWAPMAASELTFEAGGGDRQGPCGLSGGQQASPLRQEAQGEECPAGILQEEGQAGEEGRWSGMGLS